MEPVTFLLAVGVGSLILFLWTGFAQSVLPWGVKSVGDHPAAQAVGEALAAQPDGMAYVKHKVAAFIAIRPERYYAMGRFFAIEFATQLLAAATLVGILALTTGLDDGARLLLVALAGAAGVASVDLQYWNWWGFSSIYTLGVAVNRLMGYLLAGFALLNWVV